MDPERRKALSAEFEDTDRVAEQRKWKMLIGGELVASIDDRTFETIDPSCERVIARVPDAGPEDVAKAVTSAQSAADGWRRTEVHHRSFLVRELATVLREHRDELAYLDALDGGNPFEAMQRDVEWAAEMLSMFADMGHALRGETIPGAHGALHYTVREPWGVVGCIIPYNHPIFFAASKIAAPLVAGNTVVLKPAPQTPLSALRMGELFADLLPEGVLNIVTGSSAETGSSLVRHPLVRRISFIGGRATGLAIQAAAAEVSIKSLTLELGGKNPLLAFADVDPEALASATVRGMNLITTNGQSCGSISRLVVHRSIHDEVSERIGELVDGIRVGDPLESGIEMGPQISAHHSQSVLSWIQSAVDEGASIAAGGGRPHHLDQGYYVRPTVLVDVTQDMGVANSEVFGPVLSIISFDDESEAISIANATQYGLTASVWTDDVRRALRVANEIQSGYLWVNGVAGHYTGVPFGGMKDSGLGREEGVEELLNFTQTKTINIIQ
jgi:2-formylbenzoate dehydrogenase